METKESYKHTTHRAPAECLISSPGGQSQKILFNPGERGCGPHDGPKYNPATGKVSMSIESRLTRFASHDLRPIWSKIFMSIAQILGFGQFLTRVGLARGWNPGEVIVIQNPKWEVVGEVVSQSDDPKGPFFPAYSYFDQFLLVKVTGRFLFNKTPLRVSSIVNKWPPEGETYRSERKIDFYDVKDPNGPAVVEFGECTIRIEEEIAEEEVRRLQGIVASIQNEADLSLLPTSP